MAAQNPGLRDELLRMVEEDQVARRAAIAANFKDTAANERMKAIDMKNTARMKEIVAQVGWPTKTLVGEKGGGGRLAPRAARGPRRGLPEAVPAAAGEVGGGG